MKPWNERIESIDGGSAGNRPCWAVELFQPRQEHQVEFKGPEHVRRPTSQPTSVLLPIRALV